MKFDRFFYGINMVRRFIQRPESDADDPLRCANGPIPRRFTVGIEVLENGRQSGIVDCVHGEKAAR